MITGEGGRGDTATRKSSVQSKYMKQIHSMQPKNMKMPRQQELHLVLSVG